MNDTLKRYIISSVTTFLTIFLGSLSIQLASGASMELTSSFVLGLVSIAGRAAVKGVVESWAGSNGDKT